VQQLAPSRLTSVYILQMNETWPWEHTVCTVHTGLIFVYIQLGYKMFLQQQMFLFIGQIEKVPLCHCVSSETQSYEGLESTSLNMICICRNMMHIAAPIVDAPGYILHAVKCSPLTSRYGDAVLCKYMCWCCGVSGSTGPTVRTVQKNHSWSSHAQWYSSVVHGPLVYFYLPIIN
jgi:hypothetical protein